MKTRLLLTFTAALLALRSWAYYDIKVDGICYNVNEDNMTAYVTYNSGTTYSNANQDDPYIGNITIPSTVTFTYTENNRTYYKKYSVTSIGYRAFSDCPGLTSVTIPNSVTSIGDYAFYGCTGLTSITIPNSVTSIGYRAFSYCPGLTSVTIGNSVTSIGYEAFADCSGLTRITIPNSVTSIGEGAFCVCTGLTSIDIPNSVTCIGERAFGECFSLTEAKIGNGIKTISEEMFYKCTKLKDIYWGASVEKIGGHAFYNCTSLDTVIIPNTVTTIGGEAFYLCTSIKSLTLPNYLISIGMEAFENCSSLKELTIPNSLTIISGDAFGGTDLRTLTIGNSVETIESGAFSTKTGQLNNIFVLRSTPPSCSEATFSSNDYRATLHVPVGARDIYSQTAPWSKFKFIVDDLPNTEAERDTVEEVTTRATAGDPMTFDDFKALAGTGKHFAIVASSEGSLVYPKWFSFANGGYPTTLTTAQLFDLENSETGEGWYNIKRISDNLYVSTEGGNFDTDPKMDFKLVNRLATDYWSEFSDASLHISFDNAEGNHYNANTTNLGFRSGTGGYSTYVAYGPFCVVTVNYFDKNDNPLEASKTFIVAEGTTIEAPAILGKIIQGASNVTITGDQAIDFKYDDSTFDYKLVVNGATEDMTIKIKGEALLSGQREYSGDEAVSESDVEVSFSGGEEFISYHVNIDGRTITIDCDDTRWPINFYKWQTFVRTDRHINGVSFNDQTVDGLYVDYRTTCYQDLYSRKAVTLTAGTSVKPSFDVLGQWMHGFVYIDLNNDGDFTDEGELVSYINKDNPNLATDIPYFTTPSTAGTYRMRVKTDWASLDPGGNIGAEATNIYSNNHIINNGGAIIDLKLVVNSSLTSINEDFEYDVNRTTSKNIFDLSGRCVLNTHNGVYILNGKKIIR